MKCIIGGLMITIPTLTLVYILVKGIEISNPSYLVLFIILIISWFGIVGYLVEAK